MINRITICPDGHIIPDSDTLGRTGEHNATVLQFSFFESLNGEAVAGLEKYLVAILPEGNLPFLIDGDFPVPSVLTQLSELPVYAEIRKGTDVLFKSYTHVFTFADTGENKTVDTIGVAVSSAREEYRAELEASLETATGENLDGKTWNELKDTVSALPIMTEEQKHALDGWDLIKAYFADFTQGSHDLFTQAPGGREYKLPYIYTPKMAWGTSRVFSTELVEVGVDVSNALGIGGSSTSLTFNPLPKLKRLTITGNENQPNLNNVVRGNAALEYIKMNTPGEEVLTANPSYYVGAFRGTALRTIDCELDFTGQTDTKNMFIYCYKLKNLRIKPFTLSTSLDLGSCQSLHHNDLGDYESLISVLNAITRDSEVAKNITITFNSAITDFTTGMVLYWNQLVFGADDGLFYSSPAEVPEGYYYVELPLYDAFLSKGVTIAWK